MPELPEVEIVARELRGFVLSKSIDGIEALWGKSFQNETDIDLSGQKIKAISKKS